MEILKVTISPINNDFLRISVFLEGFNFVKFVAEYVAILNSYGTSNFDLSLLYKLLLLFLEVYPGGKLLNFKIQQILAILSCVRDIDSHQQLFFFLFGERLMIVLVEIQKTEVLALPRGFSILAGCIHFIELILVPKS